MSQETSTPVQVMHRDKHFKGVIAHNVRRIEQLSPWLCLYSVRFQPWLKWSILQRNDMQCRQAYYWLDELAKIWKLPYSQHIRSYVIRRVHIHEKNKNSIFLNAAWNVADIVQGGQQRNHLQQRNYLLNHYDSADKYHVSQAVTLRRHNHHNIRQISLLSTSGKSSLGRNVNKSKPGKNQVKGLTSERPTPSYIVQSTEIESFVYHRSEAVDKHHIHNLSKEKQLEKNYQRNKLVSSRSQAMPDDVSSIFVQLPRLDNKHLTNSINRIYKNSPVIHRHGMSLIEYVAHIKRNIAVSSIHTYSNSLIAASKHKRIQGQQAVLQGNFPQSVSADITNTQYALRNSEAETLTQRPVNEYAQEKKNYTSTINAMDPLEIRAYPDQHNYVYSCANILNQAKNREKDNMAVEMLVGELTPGNRAESIEHQIEQYCKKKISDLEKKSLNRKYIARDAYQLMNKQLVRELERLGR